MVSKKRSDFFTVIFQRIAGAQQLVFFAILVIVVNFRAGGKIVEANLQPCRADLNLEFFCPLPGLSGQL